MRSFGDQNRQFQLQAEAGARAPSCKSRRKGNSSVEQMVEICAAAAFGIDDVSAKKPQKHNSQVRGDL